MPQPCCLDCKTEMKKTVIGTSIAIMARNTGEVRPYQIYSADIHECPHCRIRVISQFAPKPFWEHFYDTPVPPVTHRIWEA